MPNKKETIKNISSQILEPFALGILALVFILPIITVMNLTPLTKPLKELTVLGVNSQDRISVNLVGGKHEIFSNEELNKLDPTLFKYSSVLNKRAADSYSKPILEIENRSTEPTTIKLSGSTLSNTKSNILLIVEKETYKIQDPSGKTFVHEITLAPNQSSVVFLSIENLSGVQFSEIFELTLSTLQGPQ